LSRRGVLILALLLPAAAPLRAQQPQDLVRRGVDAYRRLAYDSAANLLRQALAARGALDASSRAEAWVYVGAAELFQGRSQAAAEAFQQALIADVTHRADPMIFPPEITNAFETTRLSTRHVQIALPEDTVVRLPSFRYSLVLHASAPHDINVQLQFEGRQPRTLYGGRISDTLALAWDGLDGGGASVRNGRVEILVVSGEPPHPRTTRTAIAIAELPVDTLAHPPAPPEPLAPDDRGQGRPGVAALLTGVLTGTLAAVLPAAVTRDARGSDRRYVVAAALGVGGLAGFIAQRPRGDAARAADTRPARDAWRARLESVRRENQERRARLGVRIRALESTRVERNSP